MPDSIRVLVVDDHDMVRRGLTVFLDNFDDLLICGEAANGADALRLCAEVYPHVVLMDMNLPDMDGIAATRLIRNTFPAVQVVILTGTNEDRSIPAALQAGALGYLSKNVSMADLANTIRAASVGKPQLSPEATQALIKLTMQPHQELPEYHLTEREQAILTLMVRGLNNKQIADQLYVSRSTVKAYVSTILSKLGVSNRIEAVRLALERSLVT